MRVPDAQLNTNTQMHAARKTTNTQIFTHIDACSK